MAGEWPVVPLGDLYDFSSGLSKPRSEFGFGFAFVTFKDVLDNYFLPAALSALVNSSDKERSACSVRRGDVFLTRTSETQEDLGMSCVALKDYPNATFNGFTKRLRPKREAAVVPEYAGYYFRGPRFRQAITAMSSLSTRASLNNDMLERLHVVLPPPPIQATIGRILKALDDKIELNRRMNATLEGISRAIFKSWFVDFDPVRQKAAGQQPVGMDAQTAALFPDSFEDSEIGEGPKGWQIAAVGDLFDITMGQSPPGDTYNETGDGLPFFQGRADFGFRYPQRRVFCTAPTRFAAPGDTLVSVRAPVGDLNMALERCAIGRGVAAVRHKTGATGFTYYGMHSLSSSFEKFEGEGTVFGSIGKKEFHGLKAVAPSEDVIHAFERVVDPQNKQIEILEGHTVSLASLRDTLLPKLLSGEVRVPEAKGIVEEATA